MSCNVMHLFSLSKLGSTQLFIPYIVLMVLMVLMVLIVLMLITMLDAVIMTIIPLGRMVIQLFVLYSLEVIV